MSGILMTMIRSGVTPGPALETHTMTTGTYTYGVGDTIRGYSSATPAIGTMSPTATSLSGATQILKFLYEELAQQYTLQFNGGTNSGWTYVTIDSTLVLTRASATYSSFTWYFNTSDTLATQIFGASGSSHTFVFS